MADFSNNMSTDFLKEDERKAVEQFIHQLGLENAFGDGIIVSEDVAIKFLMARKFDVGRAISLYHSNMMLRGQFELEDLNPHVEPLATELKSGKFTILRGKGEDNATVCLFYAKKHQPKTSDHITVLRSLVFQLDYVMKFRDTQRNGLSLIYTMASSGYQNFDFDLAMKVLHLLKGGYPARLKHVYIISAPIWFRASLAILSSFLRDKIRDRVEVLKSNTDLFRYVSREVLPLDMDGLCDHNHAEWLQECIQNSGCDVKTIVLNVEYKDTESKDDIVNDTSQQNGYFSPHKELPPPPIPPRRSPSPTPLEIKPYPADPPDIFEGRNNVEESGEYDKPLPHVPEIEVEMDLSEFIAHMKKISHRGLQLEFEKLRSFPLGGRFEATIESDNLRKNRYGNIFAYEGTRVKLEQQYPDPHSDYIHANYVDGYNYPKKFICTQGPLPNTFNDFWRMIWEKKVIVIIMITRCIERGRTKCGQYWPVYQDETIDYGKFSVTHVTSDVQNDFTTILFDIHNRENQVSRRVCHIQFTSWPDFGVLTSADPIIDVIELVEQYQKEGMEQMKNEIKADISLTHSGDYTALKSDVTPVSFEGSGEYTAAGTSNGHVNDTAVKNESTDITSTNISYDTAESNGNSHIYMNVPTLFVPKPTATLRPPPIVVHCSAGVGRTGTFCCLSNSIDRFNANGTIDVFNTVKDIRNQRAFSVQTSEQYQFCNTGILEYILRKNFDRNEKQSIDLKQVLREFQHGGNQSD